MLEPRPLSVLEKHATNMLTCNSYIANFQHFVIPPHTIRYNVMHDSCSKSYHTLLRIVPACSEYEWITIKCENLSLVWYLGCSQAMSQLTACLIIQCEDNAGLLNIMQYWVCARQKDLLLRRFPMANDVCGLFILRKSHSPLLVNVEHEQTILGVCCNVYICRCSLYITVYMHLFITWPIPR